MDQGLVNFMLTGEQQAANKGDGTGVGVVQDYKERVDFLSLLGLGGLLAGKEKKGKTDHHDKDEIEGLEDAEEGMHEVNGKKVFVQDDGTTSVPKGGAVPKKVAERIKPKEAEIEVVEVKELSDDELYIGVRMKFRS